MEENEKKFLFYIIYLKYSRMQDNQEITITDSDIMIDENP